jgi:transcriptional regulator with XRE-family HTH domain
MEKRYKLEVEKLGARIKFLRRKKGLSQLDLEIQSGINRTEISKIENGLKNIEFLTIVRLAVALEVELMEFFEQP